MSDKRTPLLLVPGLTCTRALWQPQIEALADIADISIGDHTRHDTMRAIARAILAAAPERFALAGLSMGGYIAFEMLRQAPERITRLALLDTRPNLDPPERAVDRRALAARAKAEGMEPVMRGFLPVFLHRDRLTDRPLVETVIKMGVDTGAEAFARQQEAIINRPDSHVTVAAIRCPTLLLVGREDVLTPPEAHVAMAAAIPGSRLEIIERCGHLSTLEAPDRVTAAMRRWLVA